MKEYKRIITKKRIMPESYEDMSRKGGNMSYDPKKGTIQPSAPGWYGPEMHPLAGYAVAKEYFKSWKEFATEMEIDMNRMPRLRTKGNDITDAFYILFGGRGGVSEINDNNFSNKEEDVNDEEGDEYYPTDKEKKDEIERHMRAYDEDDMIEYVWHYIFRSPKPPLKKIVKFIDDFDSDGRYDVQEAAGEYSINV